MQSRAKSAPKLRKIDLRIPVLHDRGAGWDTPLFDSADRALLQAIDGQSTVRDLAAATGRTEEETARSLAKLERLALITFAEAAKRPAVRPKRLQSGTRPAMKTCPGDLTEELRKVANDATADGVHEKPTVAPPPGDSVVEVVETHEVDDLLASLDVEEEDLDPGARFTLPGIGTRG
jgi:hypothetical protein